MACSSVTDERRYSSVFDSISSGWLRTSTSGGAGWTGPSQQLSAYDPSQSQSQPNGFGFPYGDYMGMAMNSCGAPLITWGEGHNWVGGPSAPGNIEFRSLC